MSGQLEKCKLPSLGYQLDSWDKASMSQLIRTVTKPSCHSTGVYPLLLKKKINKARQSAFL